MEIRENSFASIDSLSQLEIRRDAFIYTGFINQSWPSFEQQSCFMFYPWIGSSAAHSWCRLCKLGINNKGAPSSFRVRELFHRFSSSVRG